MQFAEGLSDRQAADAVRGQPDWKYVLGLELTGAGFDYSVLSKFRSRLLAGQKEQALLDELTSALKQLGLLKASKRTTPRIFAKPWLTAAFGPISDAAAKPPSRRRRNAIQRSAESLNARYPGKTTIVVFVFAGPRRPPTGWRSFNWLRL